MPKADIVIYGAGSVGRLIEQFICDINEIEDRWNLIGYLEDDKNKHNKRIGQSVVLGGLGYLHNMHYDGFIALGIGKPADKYAAVTKLMSVTNFKYANIIHPTAWVSKRVTMGHGVIIYPGVCIDVDVKLGDHILLNKSSTLGHDSVIDSYVTVSPGVNLGGNNYVGEGCEFGINSCTIQNLSIGKWSVIGAGAAVIHDLPSFITAVGVPARVIKKNVREL
jgi:sugar O-acyltransferase (sialic acid O-acetyltransferase NeuD family)